MKRLFVKGSSRVSTLAYAAALACVLVPGLSAAQAPARTASPAAAGNQTKPQYDTETPQYDVSSAASNSAKTVVAEVDGRAITLGQVGDMIRDLPPAQSQKPFEELYPSVLQQLIVRQALVIRAQQKGLDDEPAVRRQIQAESDRILSEEYASRETTARTTEKMLRDKYNEVVAGQPGPEQVRFRTIMVGSEKEALDLAKEIQAGGDFAAVARRVSRDPSAPIGGEVPFTAREGLTPEIGAVVFALSPGQVAPYPVRSAGAWFLVKVEERRPGPTPPFPAVRESLLRTLQREGALAVMKDAMAHVTVREFAITGKETDAGQR